MRAALLFLLALAHDARAHDVDLAGLLAVAEDAERSLAALQASQQLGGALLPPEEHLLAYQEATAAFLLGDHDEAAQRFFVLRSVIDEPSLRAEVDWYLVQALAGAGYDRLADGILEEITGLAGSGSMDHPFRREAAALLLERSATRRPPEAFARLHEALEERGLVGADPALVYRVGRAWFLAGERVRAREVLGAIPPDHSAAPRARYLLATLDLLDGRRDDAADAFARIAEGDVSTPTDRHVADLARLAVARIAYEQGRYDDAALHYARVGGESPVLEDALYELAWTHIARGDDGAALRAVDLFLLAFPESARAGRMTVAKGHLQMRQGAWEEATWTYEGIDARFEGIETRLAGLECEGIAAALGGGDDVPPWVRQRLAAHPELGRAVALQEDLERARAQLADADALGAELELELAGDVELKRHRRLRRGLFQELIRLAEAALDAVRLQIDGLLHGQGREGRARARALQPQVAELQRRLDRLREREAVQLGVRGARVDVLVTTEAAWALVATDLHSEEHPGLAAALGTLQDLYVDAQHQLDDLDAEADAALRPLQRQLAHLHRDLATLHLAHRDHVEDSQGTREAAIAAGVAEVAALLDDGIRDARAGMADAAFAELQQTLANREDLQRTRDEMLQRLEQQFATARSRL